MSYDELVKELRNQSDRNQIFGLASHSTTLLLGKAADAIEELADKVDRAIAFWDSKEIAETMRNLNSYLPDITDPEWQKVHMDMGFYSPLGEVYKEMGLYDEPPKGDEA